MITIISRCEDTQMPLDVDKHIWRQIKGAFQTSAVKLVCSDEELEAALAASVGARVFLEPTGTKDIGDIPAGDIVLVLGNTAMNNLAWAESDETYSIKLPSQATHLYGSSAAAIALAIRYGQ